jgi:hypothetical protein
MSVKTKCEWCNCVIKGSSVKSSDNSLQFCDVICAKLFRDNILDFGDINSNDYTNSFNNSTLSAKSKLLYELLRDTLFKMLPIKKVDDLSEGNRNEIKIHFFKVLRMS